MHEKSIGAISWTLDTSVKLKSLDFL